jgi:chemotaxis-related protein WspB
MLGFRAEHAGPSMLFLTFRTGHSHCAVEAKGIVEVLPLLQIDALPGSAPGIVGVMNYRGSLLPVIDLSQLVTGKAAARLHSSRILITPVSSGDYAGQHVGVLVDGATQTLRLAPERFVRSHAADATWAAREDFEGASRLIQRIDLQTLIPTLLEQARAQRRTG